MALILHLTKWVVIAQKGVEIQFLKNIILIFRQV